MLDGNNKKAKKEVESNEGKNSGNYKTFKNNTIHETDEKTGLVGHGEKNYLSKTNAVSKYDEV